MATLDKETLKRKFADGEKPTGEDFSDLIDTIQSGSAEVSTTIVPVSDQTASEGTNTTGFISSSGVKAYVDGQRATQAEAQAGTSNDKLMTPLRTDESINFRRATQAEAQAGTSNDKLMTPLRTDESINFRRATQVQAEAGNTTATLMTPLRSRQAIDFRRATQIEAQAGASHDKLMTPARTKSAITAAINPLQNNVQYFYSRIPGDRPLQPGSWTVTLNIPHGTVAYYMYEYFFATATTVVKEKIFVTRKAGELLINVFSPNQTVPDDPSSFNSSISITVPDDTTNTRPRIFYLRSLTRDSISGLSSVTLNHPASNISLISLSPLYTI